MPVQTEGQEKGTTLIWSRVPAAALTQHIDIVSKQGRLSGSVNSCSALAPLPCTPFPSLLKTWLSSLGLYIKNHGVAALVSHAQIGGLMTGTLTSEEGLERKENQGLGDST